MLFQFHWFLFYTYKNVSSRNVVLRKCIRKHKVEKVKSNSGEYCRFYQYFMIFCHTAPPPPFSSLWVDCVMNFWEYRTLKENHFVSWRLHLDHLKLISLVTLFEPFSDIRSILCFCSCLWISMNINQVVLYYVLLCVDTRAHKHSVGFP